MKLVFMPSAAIATTRQARDVQPRPCCSAGEIVPAELASTIAANSHRNQGTRACLPDDGEAGSAAAACSRAVLKASDTTSTTSASIDTRNSFTMVALSPASVPSV